MVGGNGAVVWHPVWKRLGVGFDFALLVGAGGRRVGDDEDGAGEEAVLARGGGLRKESDGDADFKGDSVKDGGLCRSS